MPTALQPLLIGCALRTRMRSTIRRRACWPVGGVRDGQLHDYYFLFVNGIAICYDLVPRPMANAIMDRLLAKMREVGYARFDLGLPGNLVCVPRKDYVHLDRRWGGGEREDNSDGFQIYENGGASACFAYFTLAALCKLDRRQEADRILFPLLEALERGGFSGRAASGMTYDWKAWDGTPWGYEGFLVDNYYVLLAVLTREQLDRTGAAIAASRSLLMRRSGHGGGCRHIGLSRVHIDLIANVGQ